MCDYFLHRLEAGEQQPAGDLTDILRAGGTMPPVDAADLPSTATEWHLPSPTHLFAPIQSSASDGADNAFGVDPFSGLPDPFSGTDYPSSSGSAAADFFDAVAQDAMDASMGAKVGNYVDPAAAGGTGGPSDMRNHHMFPTEMPTGPYAAMGRGAVKLGGQGLCPFDGVGGLQMPSSPRAGGAIKRRKNQARKVVCIPAPEAAVAGRTTGEVVPSDLWAWRKYGQKPIKGSPYPRGYYRCSSSKGGCPARKQVERSRTDPNTLVITYTSEHNHPWPTQRNVLAGSTRSQYAKNSSNTAAANSSKINSSSRHQQQKHIVIKAEPRDQSIAATSTTTMSTGGNNAPPAAVKKEAVGDDTSAASLDGHLLQQMFSQSCYKPMIPDQIHTGGGHHDDFFADLTELDSDPVSLIFSAEYMETCRQGGEPHKEKAVDNKDLLDPFLLDWAPAG